MNSADDGAQVVAIGTPHSALPGTSANQKPPPLTLYIHLPWCGRKCPYCDFNSHKAPSAPGAPSALPEREYLAALVEDLTRALPAVWGRQLKAIFIGGGTPSLFSAAAINELLAQVRMLFNFSPEIEVTLEANPDSSDIAKFAGFRRAGINRLSLGVQSFNDSHLRQLGRLHDAAAARRAAQAAADTFDNFNIDLMHALPTQQLGDAIADVDAALDFAPTHLSLYQLTLEANTPFYRQPPPHLPDEDATAAMGDAVRAHAQAAGYHQYEVSAYAQSGKQGGRQCRHNLNYWQFGDYLGIGAGAHSKITNGGGDGKVVRETRIKHPGDYMRRAMEGNAIASRQTLGKDDIVFEFMLNALRLCDGFPTALLTAHTGGGTPRLRRALAAAAEQGLIEHTPQHIRPSEKGQRYLNDLVALFLPDAPDNEGGGGGNGG